jgi:hypothetical protein
MRQDCRGEVLRLRYCNLFRLLLGVLRRFLRELCYDYHITESKGLDADFAFALYKDSWGDGAYEAI